MNKILQAQDLLNEGIDLVMLVEMAVCHALPQAKDPEGAALAQGIQVAGERLDRVKALLADIKAEGTS